MRILNAGLPTEEFNPYFIVGVKPTKTIGTGYFIGNGQERVCMGIRFWTGRDLSLRPPINKFGYR
jgi:hypothetical protein